MNCIYHDVCVIMCAVHQHLREGITDKTLCYSFFQIIVALVCTSDDEILIFEDIDTPLLTSVAVTLSCA